MRQFHQTPYTAGCTSRLRIVASYEKSTGEMRRTVTPPRLKPQPRKPGEKADPEPKSASKTGLGAEQEAAPANKADPAADPGAAPVNKADPGAKQEAAPASKADPAAEPGAAPANKADPASKADTVADPGAAPVSKADPGTKQEAAPANKTDPAAEPGDAHASKADPAAGPEAAHATSATAQWLERLYQALSSHAIFQEQPSPQSDMQSSSQSPSQSSPLYKPTSGCSGAKNTKIPIYTKFCNDNRLTIEANDAIHWTIAEAIAYKLQPSVELLQLNAAKQTLGRGVQDYIESIPRRFEAVLVFTEKRARGKDVDLSLMQKVGKAAIIRARKAKKNITTVEDVLEAAAELSSLHIIIDDRAKQLRAVPKEL